MRASCSWPWRSTSMREGNFTERGMLWNRYGSKLACPKPHLFNRLHDGEGSPDSCHRARCSVNLCDPPDPPFACAKLRPFGVPAVVLLYRWGAVAHVYSGIGEWGAPSCAPVIHLSFIPLYAIELLQQAGQIEAGHTRERGGGEHCPTHAAR